ncbi:MAG TPA: hypothetical protein VGD14_20945 [bacterium]
MTTIEELIPSLRAMESVAVFKNIVVKKKYTEIEGNNLCTRPPAKPLD